MSEENVEIVRASIDAYNQGDFGASLKDAAPDFEFDLSRADGPWHGVYGLDRIRRLWEELADVFEATSFEPREFIEASEDTLVIPVTMHTRGRDQIETRARIAWVCTVRDGKMLRICMYQTLEEALEAGLSD